MTMGQTVRDLRTQQQTTDVDCYGNVTHGLGTVGPYFSKTWNGGNSPRTTRALLGVDTFTYRTASSSGRHRVKTVRVKRWSYPKRQLRTENAYECTIVSNSDVILSATKGCPEGFSDGRTSQSAQISSSFVGGLGPGFSETWDANDQIALIGQLSEKISGESFNAAVFLGEGREALQTIANAAQRIALSMKMLKRGNLAAAAESLVSPTVRRGGRKITAKRVSQDWVASNWLSLQYGWKPLIQDIYGAASHFAHQQNRPQVLTFRVSSRREVPVKSPSPNWKVGGTVQHFVQMKALVKRIDEVGLLGLTDPASLVWEKLPYSFVVDWLLPVGNYLAAANLLRSLEATYVISHKYRLFSVGGTFLSNGYSLSGAVKRETVYVRREIFGIGGQSALTVPLPKFKPLEKVATFSHCVNSLALLTNAFKR